MRMSFESGYSHSDSHKPKPRYEKASNIDDAKQIVHELCERGERPVVSVPIEYENAIAKGLSPKSTWIPGFDAIVGTLGRDPYLPGNQKRVLVEIDIDEANIIPRFTGPGKSFDGVVVLRGPIPPEKIRKLH